MVRETKIVVIHNLIRISRSTPASTVSFEYTCTWAVENFNGLSSLHRYLLTRYNMFVFFSFFFPKKREYGVLTKSIKTIETLL